MRNSDFGLGGAASGPLPGPGGSQHELPEQTLETLRKLNGCDETGSQWAEGCTLYASKTGTPVVTLIHPGAHNFPPEAPALFVKFFKEHARN